jgi:hypothetical protein
MAFLSGSGRGNLDETIPLSRKSINNHTRRPPNLKRIAQAPRKGRMSPPDCRGLSVVALACYPSDGFTCCELGGWLGTGRFRMASHSATIHAAPIAVRL